MEDLKIRTGPVSRHTDPVYRLNGWASLRLSGTRGTRCSGPPGTAGFAPSKRLLSDWVSLGLLDQSTRRGLGRGKGTEATWPQQQLNLFLALLEKHPTVSHIAPLCNLPVFLWLWFGDEFVPTRQARRALMTWGGANRHSSSWRAARAAAVTLAGQFAHPDANERALERFITAIARATYGAPFDAEAVLGAFRDVFDPHGENRSVGPAQVRFRPEYFVALVKARLAALEALRRDDGSTSSSSRASPKTPKRSSSSSGQPQPASSFRTRPSTMSQTTPAPTYSR